MFKTLKFLSDRTDRFILKQYRVSSWTPLDDWFNIFLIFDARTAWKVSKYGVISGPCFPVLGMNADIYSVNTGQYGPEITLYLDTSYIVGGTKNTFSKQLITWTRLNQEIFP